jgi:hypothetical protein
MITDAREQLANIGYRAAPLRPRQSIDKRQDGSIRAASNTATWRTYLPEDCVVAMISSGWDLST